MFVERYLTNKNNIETLLDDNGILIGTLTSTQNDDNNFDYVYSFEKLYKIYDLLSNNFSIIVGIGGLGKTTLLQQLESYLNNNDKKYIKINLRDLVCEFDLKTKMFKQLENMYSSNEIYVLLDAIDEAIDHNIRNPIELIVQNISEVIEKYPKVKFLLTSRHQVSNLDNLESSLRKIYKISNEEEKYIYNLCPLTRDDISTLSKYYGIYDENKFFEDIKKYNLLSFLATPITLKAIIELYKNKNIQDNINYFDIYLEAVKNLCVEKSEYRKLQAADKIGKYCDYPSEELLIIAAKLATDIKIKNRNAISKQKESGTLFVGDYYSLEIKTENKKYLFSEELISAVLRTDLFHKTDGKYFFSQKTYIDFLCAYYLLNINIDINSFNKLFLFDKKIHPNYYEVLSFISLKKNDFFEFYKKKNPEALIFSNILFNNPIKDKELLEGYFKYIERHSYNSSKINPSFICKKLFIDDSYKIIKKFFKSKNNDILYALLVYIRVNKISNFKNDIKNVLFNKEYSNELKEIALYIVEEHEDYQEILLEVYNNINKLEIFLKNDEENNLRATLLEVLYPKYFSDDEMLKYIVPIKKFAYFGKYNHFIRYDFLNPKYINKKNYLKFFKWVINNKIKGITISIHGSIEFPDNIKSFFNSLTEFIENKDLLDEIINFQTKHFKNKCVAFSDSIFKKISENNKIRLYFLKNYIKNIDEQYKLGLLTRQHIFKSADMAYLLALFHNEKDLNLKEKYRIAINYFTNEYWNTPIGKDYQYLCNIFTKYEKLKDEFEILYTGGCELDELTMEPLDGNTRKWVREYLKFEQENKNEELEFQKREKEQKEINEYNSDTNTRVKENLLKYKDTKEIKYINNIFLYLTFERDGLYPRSFIDFCSTFNWKFLDEDIRIELINSCLDILRRENSFKINGSLEEYIKHPQQLLIWNCLGALAFHQTYLNDEEYKFLLIKHKIGILYFNSFFEDDFLVLEELISDLYLYEKIFIEENIYKIIKLDLEYYTSYIDLFKKFNKCDNTFLPLLENLYNSNKNILCEMAEQAIIEYLIEKNSDFAIKICIKDIKNNIKNETFVENKKPISFLNILLKYFRNEYWDFISKIFYENKKGIEIFKHVAHKFDFKQEKGSCLYEQINDKDLVKFYFWINKNIPKPEYTEIVHDYRPEEEISNNIYNFWINNGKINCIKQIRKNMKNESAYKRTLNMTFNQYLIQKTIKINELKKLETKKEVEKVFIKNDNSININNTGEIKTNNIGHTYNKNVINPLLFIFGIIILIFFILFLFGIIDENTLKSALNLINSIIK